MNEQAADLPSIAWGIIGCGDVMERKAGAALASLPGSRIVTVMRRDAAKAQAFAKRHLVPNWTTDASAVIASPHVNAIYIATPPAHHLEYALQVCAAGKACVVEKPAGRSEQETHAMVDAFRRAAVPLYVSYYRRDLAKFERVKQIIDSGELGAIVAINYRFAKPRSAQTWRIAPSRSGGGHFYDLAGHALDLFDDWFGPLELLGSGVTNRIPSHETEDAVALTFRTPDGAIGSASWNFAAAAHMDELCIEGLGGQLHLAVMASAGSVRLELTPAAAVRTSRTRSQRALRQIKSRFGVATHRRFRFTKPAQAHRDFLARVVGELARGEVASPSAALRTSVLLNRVLDHYYGGRCGAFWERPARWQSLRQQAVRRGAGTRDYALDGAQLATFEAQGYLGPFQCDGEWQRLRIPLKKGTNLHLSDPAVFELCTHPSIAHRAAQMLGPPGAALFKSRFVVKAAGGGTPVAWHQDVGETNGGYYAGGAPVPSVTCWLALDRTTLANGAVRVVPGSHKALYGDYRARLRAKLLEHGVIAAADVARAVTFELEPGQFYLFHSWLLHGSDVNRTRQRRAGLNMRYTRIGDEYEAGCIYLPLAMGS